MTVNYGNVLKNHVNRLRSNVFVDFVLMSMHCTNDSQMNSNLHLLNSNYTYLKVYYNVACSTYYLLLTMQSTNLNNFISIFSNQKYKSIYYYVCTISAVNYHQLNR